MEETLRNITQRIIRDSWIPHGTKNIFSQFCSWRDNDVYGRSLWSAIQYECNGNPALLFDICVAISASIITKYGVFHENAPKTVRAWSSLPHRTQNDILAVLQYTVDEVVLQQNPELQPLLDGLECLRGRANAGEILQIFRRRITNADL